MKIVLSLVLVACVAIQASPVNKTSVGEGADGEHPMVQVRILVRHNKYCTPEELHHWQMTGKLEKKKTKKPCVIQMKTQYRCAKCDKKGKHCKAVKFSECKPKGKVGDVEHGEDGKGHAHCITTRRKNYITKSCTYSKDFDGPRDGDDEDGAMKCFNCGFDKAGKYSCGKTHKCPKSWGKTDGDEDDDEDGKWPKWMDMKHFPAGDDGDDGAHPKIVIGKLCIKCDKKHCEKVKCKDGEDEPGDDESFYDDDEE